VADLFALNDEYNNRWIVDGTQWVVRLRAGGNEKRVFCSNEFPRRLRVLSRTLREKIIVRQTFADNLGVDRLGVGAHRRGGAIHFAFPIAIIGGHKQVERA
jgi:hypothetical protein